jgi:hypothetical protein
VAFHFGIALTIAATYVMASRRIPVLAARPWLCGPIYGVAVYLAMNFLVVPLSALGAPRFTPFGIANGLLIHMFGVGLPSAIAASRVAGTPASARPPKLLGTMRG